MCITIIAAVDSLYIYFTQKAVQCNAYSYRFNNIIYIVHTIYFFSFLFMLLYFAIQFKVIVSVVCIYGGNILVVSPNLALE